MPSDDDRYEIAVDPGDPASVVASEEEPTEEANEEGPEAQIIVDEESGKTYIAFEIDSGDIEEETSEEGEGE